MNSAHLNIDIPDLGLLVTSGIGLAFGLMLFISGKGNRAANRWLGSVLLVIIVGQIRTLLMDMGWAASGNLDLASLGLGPLIYGYVSSIVRPGGRFRFRSLLQCWPVFAGALLVGLGRNGKLLHVDVLTVFNYGAGCCFVWLSYRLIRKFLAEQQFTGTDRYRLKLGWLKAVTEVFAFGWLLCLPLVLAGLSPAWLQVGSGIFWIGVAGMAILRPESHLPGDDPYFLKVAPRDEFKQQAAWLKKELKRRAYYRDPELSLGSLAGKLGMTTHELSGLINTVLKKNYNDFINGFRVAEVISRLRDPAYDQLTLEGIAYGAGFNSPRTFHRVFKDMTGKTPAEFKKELPSYHLAYGSGSAELISVQKSTNRNFMFKNYLKIAWRNIVRKKASSLINITGLAVGMAVAMLIGLWIWDELTFNKFNTNYDRIVQVLANKQVGGGLATQASQPFPLSAVLREQYGSDFKAVAAAVVYEQDINYHNHAFSRTGCFAEPAMTGILTLHMMKGSKAAFSQPGTTLINESFAHALFGDADPIDKIIKISDAYLVRVAGVYEDLPRNTQFGNVEFIAPIRLLFGNAEDMNNWNNSSFQVFALLNKGSQPAQVTRKIRNILCERRKDATKPALVLFPMRAWHLYEFKEGVLVAGRLQFVWLFGIIGLFVLLLACINFMNLSTARSERRAKEVGIRKAIGSLRVQLVVQFLGESFLIVALSFVLAVLLAWLSLPLFNDISGKQLHLIWNDPLVWLACLCFCVLTGLVAGSYPAIYLSSFNAVRVLKGTFKAGPSASLPRKVLVVLQFAVSVTIITGTIVVFKQIEFARDRPVGYDRDHLVMIPYNGIRSYRAFRQELLNTGVVTGVTASGNPTTGTWSSADNLGWRGKDPNRQEVFGTVLIDPDFGSVVGWKMKEGRNFSKEFLTDSAGFLFNEAAIRQMGLKQPVGETIQWHGKDWKVLGVVKDMVMNSPFEPVTPVVFLMDDRERSFNVIIFKLKAGMPVSRSLAGVETVFKKYAPEAPFNYKFADSEYAQKFLAEERTGKLASIFAGLAIFISCLGLFGVASFVAEQRIKEIGVRKVLGASVAGIWGLLSKEFVMLVSIALLIAVPVSWYFMHQWLQQYTYRTGLSWWVFALTGAGAVMITLLTVSYHSLKAALTNPVKSLRSE